MIIQFNTDKNISGNEKKVAAYSALIEDELRMYSSHITRLEIHLSDENGNNNGPNTMRCMIEARVEGLQPIAVTDLGDTHYKAVTGALNKLSASLNTIMGKLTDH